VLSIRPATAEDAGLLATMIRELADFERELDSVSITEADLVRDGFGADPKFRAVIAEWDWEAAGYAFFFHFYSTWQGPQLFLEDFLSALNSAIKGLEKPCSGMSRTSRKTRTAVPCVGRY